MAKQIALYFDHIYQRQTHICYIIEHLGFKLYTAPDLPVARKMLKKYFYHLVLIHFDTIGRDIFELCSFIRSGSIDTIIMVLMTSIRVNVEEFLFDCGVDDVVIGKQASARILAKRIRARFRNFRPSLPKSNIIKLKDTLFDFDRREIWCNGSTRRLPGILFDLLKYFLDNSSRVISRDELLMSSIWRDSICSSAEEGGKTFDVNICKLRKIIEPNPMQPQIIKTVRGVGWKLAKDIVV
jgi:DNA-binding response OmpR family regulator